MAAVVSVDGIEDVGATGGLAVVCQVFQSHG